MDGGHIGADAEALPHSHTHTHTHCPTERSSAAGKVCVELLECVVGRETASKRHFRSVPSKNKVLQLDNGGVIEIFFAECHSKSTGLCAVGVGLRLFLLLRPIPPTMPLSSSCGVHTVHGRLAQLFLPPAPTKSCHSGRGGKARIPNLPTGQFCNGFDQAPRKRQKWRKADFLRGPFFGIKTFLRVWPIPCICPRYRNTVWRGGIGPLSRKWREEKLIRAAWLLSCNMAGVVWWLVVWRPVVWGRPPFGEEGRVTCSPDQSI